MEPLRNKRSALAWALLAASWTGVGAGAGAALGCSDIRKTAQEIAREEPAALSLGADNKPGEGPAKTAPEAPPKQTPDAPDAPADPAAPEIDDVHAGEEDAAEATSSSRRRAVARTPNRRRRAASAERIDAEKAEEAEEKGPRAAAAGERPGAAAGSLQVARLQVARNVSGREPVGVSRSFAAGDADRLFAFVELTNDERTPAEIFVTFTPPGGGAAQRIPLKVGAERRWRTWAATRRVRVPGVWSVTITDAEGRVLGRTSFTVTR